MHNEAAEKMRNVRVRVLGIVEREHISQHSLGMSLHIGARYF